MRIPSEALARDETGFVEIHGQSRQGLSLRRQADSEAAGKNPDQTGSGKQDNLDGANAQLLSQRRSNFGQFRAQPHGFAQVLAAAGFEVVAHHAAIRPTVKDRRPFIGQHPQFPVLGIFNGFGTKGASLVPFFAEQFVDNLLNGKPLEKEVDIRRFRYV